MSTKLGAQTAPSRARTTAAALATFFNAAAALPAYPSPHAPGQFAPSIIFLSQQTVQSAASPSLRASDDPDRCQGEVEGLFTGTLKSCEPSPTAAGAYEWATCDSKNFTLAYFTTPNCGGKAVFAQQIPLDQCWMHVYGTRGLPVKAHCNAAGYNLSTYTLAPPKPTNMSCIVSQDAARSGLSITLRAAVNATLAKQVSFEVFSKEDRTFLSSTATVSSTGFAEAVVTSLEADHGLASAEGLRLGARAHGLTDEEGNPAYWSEITGDLVSCTAAHETVEAVEAAAGTDDAVEAPASDVDSASSAPSRWIELYRIVTGGKFNDFLDQHNAADLLGSVNWLTVPSPGAPPITRYCVEVLDVILDEIITAESDGRPRTSPFANFASCNEGQCECMHQVDRSIARLPRKQIEDLCGNRSAHDELKNTCECSAKSSWQSSRYVGRTPVPYPFDYYTKALMSAPIVIPQDYPHAWEPDPKGFWYSFPAAARCRPGQALGDGNCTWRREDASSLVYLDQLNASGLNHTVHTFNTSYGDEVVAFPTSVGLQNAMLLERLFESLPLRLPPCGPARKVTSTMPTGRKQRQHDSRGKDETEIDKEEEQSLDKSNPSRSQSQSQRASPSNLAGHPPGAEGGQGEEIIML